MATMTAYITSDGYTFFEQIDGQLTDTVNPDACDLAYNNEQELYAFCGSDDVIKTAIPLELNGYPVIDWRQRQFIGSDKPTFFVMIDRRSHNGMSYVVATWNENCGNTWHNGDYFDSYEAADAALWVKS